jgi:hypothetical protein
MTPMDHVGTAFSIRHALATLAYRAVRVVEDAPPDFATFEASATTRTPVRILAHMGDLMDWALSLVEDAQRWHEATPLPWNEEAVRFFQSLAALDERTASIGLSAGTAERLFQGPIADALTHVGQLAMLRRIAGSPIRGENYYIADIAAGRVGIEQAAPRKSFA